MNKTVRTAVFAFAVLWAAQANPVDTTALGAPIVNYSAASAAAYGGYTTHRWEAIVNPEPVGLGVLTVMPDLPVNRSEWRLSVNGQLFEPVAGSGLRFEDLPLPEDAVLFGHEYRWQEWPTAIRWSAYEREHTFLVYRGQPLALPSVLDLDDRQ